MSFNNTSNIPFDHLSYTRIGSGVSLKESLSVIHATSDYVDGTVVGRFGQIKTSTKDPRGQLANLDGTANPKLAVVLRDSTTATENDGLLKNPYHTQMSYLLSGYVTIEVDPAITPAFKDKVYVINTAGATIGKVTNVSTGNIAIDAYFDVQVDAGVWSIVIK